MQPAARAVEAFAHPTGSHRPEPESKKSNEVAESRQEARESTKALACIRFTNDPSNSRKQPNGLGKVSELIARS